MAKKSTKSTPARGRPLAPAPAQAQTGLIFLSSAAELGRAIEQARLFRGFSQATVAGMAKVNRRFVADLENGKPSAQLQKALTVMMCVGLVGVAVPVEAMQGSPG